MAKFVVLCSLLLVAANCTYDPCADKGSRAAWIAGGGPIGAVAALALSCAPPEPAPEPIVVVASAGLEVEAPPPDMAEPSPDLSTPPDLTPPDRDGDGVSDGADKCPGTPAGQSPDPQRAGCPAPTFYEVAGSTVYPFSGTWALTANVWQSAPNVNWATYRPISSTLALNVSLPQTAPATQKITAFEFDAVADIGPVNTSSSCMGLKDLYTNPSNSAQSLCFARNVNYQIFDAQGNELTGAGGTCVAAVAGPQIVKCKLALGTNIPLPSGATSFQVRPLADGTVKLSALSASATVLVTLL